MAIGVALDSIAPWINETVKTFEQEAGEASQLKSTAEEITMKLMEKGLARALLFSLNTLV